MHPDKDRPPGTPGRGHSPDRADNAAEHGMEQTGGVRQHDGPEPYDDTRGTAPADATSRGEAGVPAQSGYEEHGPGRGDYAGRGEGNSRASQPGADQQAERRARWRDGEPDERSDRWEDAPGDEDPSQA
ncbi:MAG TPA: hypothetical protein VIG97_03245 [Luteimonas sp.]